MQLVASRPSARQSAEAPARDETTFAQLYQQHSSAIYNFVLRSVRDSDQAQDVCQEIWVTVHRQLDTLQNPDCFRSWLYRIATRACIDAARRNSRLSAPLPLPDSQKSNQNVEEVVTGMEHSRLVWQALAALPPRQHMALFLKVVEGRTYREITEIMQTSQDGVADLVYRARRRLVTAYKSLEPSSERRCRLARRAMAALVDGEATKVQVNALRAHTMECRGCRSELPAQQAASRGYAALALVPVPSALTRKVLAAAQAQSLGSASVPVFKLLGLGLVKTNLIGLAATAAIVGGIAVSGDQSVGTTGSNGHAGAPAAPQTASQTHPDLAPLQGGGHQGVIDSLQLPPIDPQIGTAPIIPDVVHTVDALTKLGLSQELAEVQSFVNGVVDRCSGLAGAHPETSIQPGALTGCAGAVSDPAAGLIPETGITPPAVAVPSPVLPTPVVPTVP